MSKAPAPPPAPDPVATANAQSAANTKAATTQQQMNMVDQVTPYGNLSYTQSGTWADGTPKFTSTTTLSPEEQRNQQQQWQFDNLVNQLGINQTQKLSGHLDKPIQLGNEATESRLMELGRQRLDPVLSQRTEALEQKLYNQGVMPGTEAYRRAMEADTQGANDAYTSLLLAGRGQANQELLAERNQPINEITALMSGGQVTQPTFGSTPQAQIAAPDIAGMTYQSHQMGPMAQWQASNQSRNAMLGGLFGIGSAALGGWGMSGFKGLGR